MDGGTEMQCIKCQEAARHHILWFTSAYFHQFIDLVSCYVIMIYIYFCYVILLFMQQLFT